MNVFVGNATRRIAAGTVANVLVAVLGGVFAQTVPCRAASECVECHDRTTPLVAADWRASRHAEEEVGCDGCHKGRHRTAQDTSRLTPITAQTCGGCHERQMQQFSAGKHSKAWEAAQAFPAAHALPTTDLRGRADCDACHKIGLKPQAEINRLRAEGSVFGHASCDSCHTRHTFSLLEARQPQACQTCHMGRSHAQWEMYSTSKHGVRALLKQSATLPGNVPAPRCQDCHMADGNHEVRTAWGFFGLAGPTGGDPQWTEDQATIMRALGLLGPGGEPTPRMETLRDLGALRATNASFEAERARMVTICSGCHAGSFVSIELAKGDAAIRDSDRMLAEAIRVVAALYSDGVLPLPAGATTPFPDLTSALPAPRPIERKLLEMHFDHRRNAFMGVFHMSPDYALWQGSDALAADLEDMRSMDRELRSRTIRP